MSSLSDETVRHLAGLYAEERRAFAFRGETREEFDAWAAAARPVLRHLVGLDRIAEDCAGFRPSASLGPAEDIGECLRSEGVLQAEPHFAVPFWFVQPKAPGPHPLALLPHGHAMAGRGHDKAVGIARDEAEERRIEAEDRDVALQAARRGFAAVAPSSRGWPPTCVHDATGRHGGLDCRGHTVHALLAGRTTVGERVWDMMRLLDWATAREDIDASRVLAMGNSAGGVTVLYSAACDERIGAAVASCSFCRFVGKSGFVHHCDCDLVPGILRFGEFHDVAGLIAPRHLLAVHGREDPLFPLEEVERSAVDLRRIFAAAGVPEHFGHEYGDGGHRFYEELMWPFVVEALNG